ncbi:MAG: DUF308 domain-containing protein [Ruminococcus sp.]|nr:DUF308 domain-containing protein [Ruminococcus sp.]
MEILKKLFRNYWVLSVFCIVLGIALIADPQFFTNALGYVVGGLFTGYGVVELVKYFAKTRENILYATGLVAGVILCGTGVFIIARPDFIPKIIAIILGLYMLISGIVNLQDGLNLKRMGYPTWVRSVVPAAVTIALGILLLVNPLMLTDAALTILGICLLISGISNIFGWLQAGMSMKKMKKAANQLIGKKGRNDDRQQFIDIK